MQVRYRVNRWLPIPGVIGDVSRVSLMSEPVLIPPAYTRLIAVPDPRLIN